MLTEICAEIKNYFAYDCDKHYDNFAIVDGQIVPSFDIPTDYIRIIGSRLNDGVHKVSDHDLINEETFEGAIWVMSPPPDFLALCDEIIAWQNKYGQVESAAMSPFNSESFGGYSYSKSDSGSENGSSGSSTWKGQFGKRLNAFRKIVA